jgi:uncharacterized protein YggE
MEVENLYIGKSKLMVSALVVICLSLTAYLVGGITTGARAEAQQADRNVISVNGTGIVKVKPDIAYINVGVETRNADAKKAQAENAEIMDRVMDKLKSMGIKEDDIKTVRYGLYPVQRYDEKTRKYYVYEYRTDNVVEVTIRDIMNTGAVIDAAASVGSNQISNIRFGIESTERYYNQALEAAIANAKGKADAIAKGLGISIKGAVGVQELGGGGPTMVRYDEKALMAVDMAEAVTTPVAVGELQISAQVAVQFEY